MKQRLTWKAVGYPLNKARLTVNLIDARKICLLLWRTKDEYTYGNGAAIDSKL